MLVLSDIELILSLFACLLQTRGFVLVHGVLIKQDMTDLTNLSVGEALVGANSVGANSFAKTVLQPTKMHRMYWPLRE
jgi:hypothetical protein